jgi:uncharacterized protein (DUF952 family)
MVVASITTPISMKNCGVRRKEAYSALVVNKGLPKPRHRYLSAVGDSAQLHLGNGGGVAGSPRLDENARRPAIEGSAMHAGGTIYKLLTRREWQAAKSAGHFTGSAVDRRDGYIHFSTAAQLQETARRHFLGETDLVVLEVPGGVLGEALKWEPSRGGDLFPHLHGPLAVRHVAAVHEAPLGADHVPMLDFLMLDFPG